MFSIRNGRVSRVIVILLAALTLSVCAACGATVTRTTPPQYKVTVSSTRPGDSAMVTLRRGTPLGSNRPLIRREKLPYVTHWSSNAGYSISMTATGVPGNHGALVCSISQQGVNIAPRQQAPVAGPGSHVNCTTN